jgi:hypothetical protein
VREVEKLDLELSIADRLRLPDPARQSFPCADDAGSVDRGGFVVDSSDARVSQQRLNDCFGLLVVAFAELMILILPRASVT